MIAPAVVSTPSRHQLVRDDIGWLARFLEYHIGAGLFSAILTGSVGKLAADRLPMSDSTVGDYDVMIILHSRSTLHRLVQRFRIRHAYAAAAHGLSAPASFGLVAKDQLVSLPFTLFTYEMSEAYLVISGQDPKPFMPRYNRSRLPLIEAARLLVNRGAMLRHLLDALRTSPHDLGAIAPLRRAVSKALLAMGDALLIASGLYHWSYRTRAQAARHCPLFRDYERTALRERYLRLLLESPPADYQSEPSMLLGEVTAVLQTHEAVFRQIEQLRLRRRIRDWAAYAASDIEYPRHLSTGPARRLLRAWRAFGPRACIHLFRSGSIACAEEHLIRVFPLVAYNCSNLSAISLSTVSPCLSSRHQQGQGWSRYFACWLRSQ